MSKRKDTIPVAPPIFEVFEKDMAPGVTFSGRTTGGKFESSLPRSDKADELLAKYVAEMGAAKRSGAAPSPEIFEALYPSVEEFAKEMKGMPAPAPEAPEYPDVLIHDDTTDTINFSAAFPDEWSTLQGQPNAKLFPDFMLPHFSQDEVAEHLQPYVPHRSDYMGQAHVMYDAALALATGSTTHLVGWPGTGKSNGVPVKLACALGLPLLRLGLNKKGMMLDDLIGREAIITDESGTHTRHRDGVLCHWVTQPCIILADEFARANAEITNGLMSLMERDGSLIVENRHEPILKRHPMCFIIASDNVKGLGDGLDRMVGTDMVDGAVLDRFEVTIEVDYLNEQQQCLLIEQWFPGFPAKEARRLSKFAGLVQQAYKKSELPLSISPRALKEIARYTCIHKASRPAVRKVFLAKLAEEADIEATKNFYRTAYGSEL